MRFMLMLEAGAESGPGAAPDARWPADLSRCTGRLAEAGVLLAAGRLHPHSRGARVGASGSHRRVTPEAIARARGLLAGFWLIQASSLQEAVEWAKRCPHPSGPGETAIHVREVVDDAGCGDAPAACGHDSCGLGRRR